MLISPQATDTNGKTIATGSQRALGKDDFMRLFVSKLQHQNPLEPLQDDAFVAQLAQFSSLEQLQNMNDNLTSNLQWNSLNSQTINNSVAAQLIGADVSAELSEISLTDSNAPELSINVPTFAKDLNVRILNQAGDVVHTIHLSNVPPGTKTITWDGKGADGKRIPAGSYALDISAKDAEGAAIDVSATITGRVTGVVYRNGAAFLQVNGSDVSLGDVRSISRPQE